jgi:hypothetical protein
METKQKEQSSTSELKDLNPQNLESNTKNAVTNSSLLSSPLLETERKLQVYVNTVRSDNNNITNTNTNTNTNTATITNTNSNHFTSNVESNKKIAQLTDLVPYLFTSRRSFLSNSRYLFFPKPKQRERVGMVNVCLSSENVHMIVFVYVPLLFVLCCAVQCSGTCGQHCHASDSRNFSIQGTPLFIETAHLLA